MQSDIVQCSLCAKLSPNMEQTAARTAAQIGCTMQCRECGRTYETQAAEITRLTEALRAAEERADERYQQAIADVVEWLTKERLSDTADHYAQLITRRFGKDA